MLHSEIKMSRQGLSPHLLGRIYSNIISHFPSVCCFHLLFTKSRVRVRGREELGEDQRAHVDTSASRVEMMCNGA